MRYLLVTYLRQANGQINEEVGFAKRIRNSDLQTCNIILDYAEQKVVKCVIEGKVLQRDFNSLHTYYEQAYPSMIGQLAKMNGAVQVVEAVAEQTEEKRDGQ
jgi:hypothetical protein